MKTRTWVVVAALLALACGKKNPTTFLGSGPNGGARNQGGASSDSAGDGEAGDGGADSDGAGGRTSGSGGRASQHGGSGGKGGEDDPMIGYAGATSYDLGSFNPEQVYLFGTLAPGAGGYDVICHWSAPNHYVAGFSSANSQTLQLLGDKLLYQGQDDIQQFVPDYEGSLKPIDLDYPHNPSANDPVVSTAPCDDSFNDVPFLTSPDGRFIYKCPERTWYEKGQPVWDESKSGYEIIAFGYDGLVFLKYGMAVMDLATGQRHTPDGFENSVPSIATVRAVKDGFHVVLRTGADSETKELWSVSSQGVGQKLGTYPALPDNVYAAGYSTKLSAADELFELGEDLTRKYDLIVRRTLAGESTIVYTEASKPWVLVHGSDLFTGP